MRLYGVDHGGNKSKHGVITGYIFLEPSSGLKDDLLELPKGSKIGLETVPPSYFEDAERRGIHYEPSSIFYWSKLIGFCNTNGFEICFLDDPKIMETTARMSSACIYTQSELSRLTSALRNCTASKRGRLKRKIKALQDELERRETETVYLFAIGREPAIFEKIRNFKPDASILGQSHSDYIMSEESVRNDLNIEFYGRDRLPILFSANGHGDEYLEAEFVKNASPRPKILAERNQIVQRFLELKK